MDDILKIVKTYWPIAILGTIVIVLLVIMVNRAQHIEDLKAELESLTPEETTNVEAENFDADAYKNTVEEVTVSAKEIGEDIIDLDNRLTEFYKTAEPLPEDKAERDAIFAQLEKDQNENAKLRNIERHEETWQLNPDWELELESVVSYKGLKTFPIVFSMKTSDGELAGFVQTTYDHEDRSIRDTLVQYTEAGSADAASLGGR